MKGTIFAGAYAMAETITEDSITYGQVKWLVSEESGGREYDFSAKGSSNEIWADGKCVRSSTTNGGYDGSLTLIDLIDDVKVDWYKAVRGKDGSIAEYADSKAMPAFAWIQGVEHDDGTKWLEIYPYVYASSRPDIKGKTTDEGEFEYEFVEHSLAIRPRPTDNIVKWEMPFSEKFTEMPDFEQALTEDEA